MTHTIFIDGAVGTTGLEIADRLSGRSEFTQIILPDDKRKDTAARREALNDADYVILCLPDDAAKEAVAMTTSNSTRIIDASTAHRVDQNWAYGFPEFRKGQA
ncbi:MAG: N-acetyl-gamma-glutamyl-phosphate reductase, partial [Sphingorhabdus sp.]